MPKYLAMLMLALLLAFTVNAQDAEEPQAAGETASTDDDEAADDTADEAAADEEEEDDSDLDEQTYEEDDDDFVPTEEIPADEPIPFPTNI